MANPAASLGMARMATTGQVVGYRSTETATDGTSAVAAAQQGQATEQARTSADVMSQAAAAKTQAAQQAAVAQQVPATGQAAAADGAAGNAQAQAAAAQAQAQQAPQEPFWMPRLKLSTTPTVEEVMRKLTAAMNHPDVNERSKATAHELHKMLMQAHQTMISSMMQL